LKQKKKICKICKQEKFLFSKGRCKECSMKDWKPIKKSNKAIPIFSESRKERNKKYKILRDEYLLSHPLCEVCNQRKATSIHHKRGRDGDNLFSYFLSVCTNCHRYIEDNPQFAKENNYSMSRIKK